MIYGTIFNIQRFSIHDGPGIRTTIFFKGCNLRCFWCHNPESLNQAPEIQFFAQKCIGCGKCIEVCPVHAHGYQVNRDSSVMEQVRDAGASSGADGSGISVSSGGGGSGGGVAGSVGDKGRRVFDRKVCLRCGRCAEACCTCALEMCGKKMSVKEAADEAEKDKAFYDNSGGGVTLSGGEPLLQAEFAAALLEECKKRGMHTAVETAGNVSWKAVEGVMPHTDLFLYDIKVADPVRHKEVTGCGNRLIIANFMKLAAAGADIIVRVPVIPGVNDTEEEMRRIADIISKTGRKLPVTLQPYHKLGQGKYTSLGLEYGAEGIEPPSEEKMKRLKDIIIKGI